MRIKVLLGLSCLAFAAGTTLTSPIDKAQAGQKKRKPAPRPYSDFSRGGIIGGSQTPQVGPVTAAWMVGAWGLERCNAPAFHYRFRADGTFSNADEKGNWRLDLGQRLPVLAMTYRRDGDAPGRAPRFTELTVARDANDRMQLNIGWWVRCSRNPDTPIAGIAVVPRTLPRIVGSQPPLAGVAPRKRIMLISCSSRGGPASYWVGGVIAGQGPDCEGGNPELVGTHQFGAAGTLYLVFKGVSATYGEGSIIYVPAEGPARVVNIGYMAEFAGAPAIDRVKIVYLGVLDTNIGTSTTVCELRIDWKRGVAVANRWVGGGRETRDNCRVE